MLFRSSSELGTTSVVPFVVAVLVDASPRAMGFVPSADFVLVHADGQRVVVVLLSGESNHIVLLCCWLLQRNIDRKGDPVGYFFKNYTLTTTVSPSTRMGILPHKTSSTCFEVMP